MQEKAEKELHIAVLVPKFFVGIIFSILTFTSFFSSLVLVKYPTHDNHDSWQIEWCQHFLLLL
jgi:hypothetical protein